MNEGLGNVHGACCATLPFEGASAVDDEVGLVLALVFGDPESCDGGPRFPCGSTVMPVAVCQNLNHNDVADGQSLSQSAGRRDPLHPA